MGNTIARTQVNQAINQMMKVSSKIVQDTGTHVSGSNILNVGKDCVLKGVNIQQDIIYKINNNSLQHAFSQITAESKLKNEAKLISDAIAQNISLTPGSTEADSIYDATLNLTTAVNNTIKNDCSVNIMNMNVVNCKGGSISDSYIKQSAIVDTINSCTQNAQAVTDARQDLENAISLVAKATVENALMGILAMVVAIILLVVVGPMVGASQLLKNIVIFATLMLGLVFLDCYLTKLLCKKNVKNWVIGIAVSLYVLVVIIYFYNRLKSKPTPQMYRPVPQGYRPISESKY